MPLSADTFPIEVSGPELRKTSAKAQRVLISGGLAVGGTQTHVSLLCAVLRQAGAEVTIASASTNWSAAAVDQIRSEGVNVVVSPFGFGPLRALGKVWAILAWPFQLRRDYDVLYCIGEGRMHTWTARFVRESGVKIYHEIVKGPQRRSVSAQVAAQMDAIVANSEIVERTMTGLLPGKPVRTIPFLTSGAPIDPPAPRRLGRGDTLRIAFLGRLAPHKRPDKLVEAFPGWASRASLAPLRLDLYGVDDQGGSARLRVRIDELGLRESVRLRGPYSTDDLDRIFAETDLVVLPSTYEGLPLVLVEAMQRGIPVVATSAGGTSELGRDNLDVIITPGTNWGAFSSGLMTMVERLRAGEINAVRLHAWTESRYGFEVVAAQWREALLQPHAFFATIPGAEVGA